MSPELETLDQLQSSDLRLSVVAKLFPSVTAFRIGVVGLLSSGDVTLQTDMGHEVAPWQWERLFHEDGACDEMSQWRLGITSQGAERIR